jgi:hypothetical protein
MSAEEFIKKWNVGFESKEQEIEFAHEMKSDLEAYHNAKLKEMMPSDEEIDRFIEWANANHIKPTHNF